MRRRLLEQISVSPKPIARGLVFFFAALLVLGAVILSVIKLIDNSRTPHDISAQNITKGKPATPSQTETIGKDLTQSYIDKGNMAGYLLVQENLARQYLEFKDYKNSARVMNGVFDRVPSAKLDVGAYEIMTITQKHLGNTAAYKHYLILLIAKQRKIGNDAGADSNQIILDAIK